jgi:hypothetical protein
VTIKDLVLRYECDVLIRIQTLEEEKAEIDGTLQNEYDEEFYRDWADQIAHWKATLADIQTVIDRERFR